MQQSSCGEEVDEFREQAASCRQLARRGQTTGGSTTLRTVAEQFDDDALRIDPLMVRESLQ